jgi:hypothetical protein
MSSRKARIECREEDELHKEEENPQEDCGDGAAEPAVVLQPVPDEAWEAFVLNEETAEPEPEYGDFWGELDEEETVW